MIKHPILKQIEEEIRAKVPEKLREAFEDAIMDGLKMMHDEKAHQLMVKQLSQEGDMMANVGEGAAKLVGILHGQSKGGFPVQALVLSGVILLCEGLEFVAAAGAAEITEESVAEAFKAYTAALMQMFKITPEKIQQMTQTQSAALAEGPAPEAGPAAGGVVGNAMQGA